MRVAIIHDYLNQYGGAERVLEALHELYPEAPIYTSLYDPAAMPDSYRGWDIRTSWMQQLPGWRQHFQKYFLLYPSAFESFDLSDYDLILIMRFASVDVLRSYQKHPEHLKLMAFNQPFVADVASLDFEQS